MIIELSHYTNASKSECICKNCDSQTKWMYLLIEDDDLLGELFGIKSALIYKKKLKANLPMIKIF